MGNKPATIQTQLKKLTLVSGDNSGKIRYWQDGKLKAEVDAHTARVRSLVKLDATRMVSASFDKTIKIWHVNDKKCLHEIQAHADDINGIALLGVDKLVSVSDDKTIKLWDLNKQTVIQSITHQTRVYSVHASKDNAFVAGNYLSTAEMYDVNSGKAVKVFQGHENAIASVLQLDDTKCATGSVDTMLKIWDMSTQQCLVTYSGHNKPVCSLAAMNNNTQVISGSGDFCIKAWNAECKQVQTDIQTQCEGHMIGNDGPVYALLPVLDKFCVSGGLDGTIRIYNDFSQVKRLDVPSAPGVFALAAF